MFQHNLLKKTLLGSAIFLLSLGLIILIKNSYIATSIGLSGYYMLLPSIGVIMILFSIFLIFVSRVTKINVPIVLLIILINLLWVIICGWLMFVVDLTFKGNFIIFLFALAFLYIVSMHIKATIKSKALKVRA
jgi:hypothetical protein